MLSSCFGSMLCVILIVTTLTESTEVFWSAVFGRMIEVGYCKHNLYHLSLVVLYYRMVQTPAELATVISTL